MKKRKNEDLLKQNKELRRILRELVNLYVKNRGTSGEYISARTPPSASSLTFQERRKNITWRAFDDARELLTALDEEDEK